MSGTEPRCERCGRVLPAGSPLGGHCPRCLLEAGLQADSAAIRLAAGVQIGPYRMEALLGQGGMGTVYRALDSKLNRSVAIKVLSDDLADATARRRFQREAQTASSLNHPHILTVYDAGEFEGRQYLVTEFVDGGTLKDWAHAEKRGWRQIVELLTGIADGLAAAHAAGIRHRDIKPANILVAKNGYAKLADFGLAKLEEPGAPVAETGTLTEGRTRSGVILGTVAYMSPEQASGRPTDARSDIFSFGVVLYELLAGRRPFGGATELEVLQTLVHGTPEPLGEGVPPALRMIVEKALEKEPAERYQSMRDLVVDLRRLSRAPTEIAAPVTRRPRAWVWIAVALVVIASGIVVWRAGFPRAGPPQIRSIAVLPLQNLSGDPNQEFFSLGATDELISSLGQIHSFEKVISRTSVMRYKGTTKSLAEIGRELNVDAVVEGSVERTGGRVRIRARLLNASTEAQLWSKAYDREAGDLLGLEAEVAVAIAQEIRLQVTPQERARLVDARKINPLAQEEYLLGRYYGTRAFTPENLREAIRHYQRATEIDGDFAAAYVGLSRAWSVLVEQGAAGYQETREAARSAALKAVQIDPDLPESHAAMGMLAAASGDLQRTVDEYKKVVELDPNNAQAYLAQAEPLNMLGRSSEGVAAAERAATLDPLSPATQGGAGARLWQSRRPDLAVPRLRKAIELDPKNPPAYDVLAGAYEMTGDLSEALKFQQEAERFGGVSYAPQVGRMYALLGRREEALRVLERVTKPEAATSLTHADFETALLYFALGDKDKAYEQLTKALEARPFQAARIEVIPRFDSIRSDSRFQALLDRFKQGSK
jgi:serine/threonine protein kinase/tetratricopeptide (TPR) repeat protein